MHTTGMPHRTPSVPTSPAAPAVIEATVNGERRELRDGSTLADLLALHGLDPRLVVVEHNRTILRDRDALATVRLADGDVVELVHFVGGG
jgi:sulfur carrier protein